MNVLLLAYACEPGAGSEYGVGWNVPVVMASRHPELSVYVLTRSRCREKIESCLSGLQVPNLHFLFYDIPRWLYYRNEMRSGWGEQYNYLLWQLLSRRFVRRKHRATGFDVIHHLTFNQYRTPSPGFWLDIPFVMGPVGGAECVSAAFWGDLDAHTRRKETIRRRGADLWLFGWLNRRRKNRKLILCSSAENQRRLQPYAGDCGMLLMPAIGFQTADFPAMSKGMSDGSSSVFEMVYAGKAWDWKGIRIYLRAVRRAYVDRGVRDFRIRLIGIRSEEEQMRVAGWVSELGLGENVELIPFVERTELLKMESSCDLSVYPAFRDSGSMSVLEACALGCPCICFAAGGQDIFPDEILLKIPVSPTYDECLLRFSERLWWAYRHRDELRTLGERARQWVTEHLTWERKVDDFVEIYRGLSVAAGDRRKSQVDKRNYTTSQLRRWS